MRPSRNAGPARHVTHPMVDCRSIAVMSDYDPANVGVRSRKMGRSTPENPDQALRKLADHQVEAFDREYVDSDRLAVITSRIDADFPDGRFTFLDVGGGNGRFADQLLERYPNARGAVLDNSETLLARNRQDPRKQVILGSAGDLQQVRGTFDVVCTHWLLHHLVGSTYGESRAIQLRTLSQLSSLLSTGGRVSVFENDYIGWLTDSLPPYLIFAATASRTLAPVARRLGANTAGVGVCFNSQAGWRDMLAASGLQVLNRTEPDRWKRRLRWHSMVFVGLKDVRVGHYWLRRATQGT